MYDEIPFRDWEGQQLTKHTKTVKRETTGPTLKRDPQAAGFHEKEVDNEEQHYRYSTITSPGGGDLPLSTPLENRSSNGPDGAPAVLRSDAMVTSSETTIMADKVDRAVSSQRQRLYRRMWYLHHDLDIRPGKWDLGRESCYYAEDHRVGEYDNDQGRDYLCLTEAVLQAMELPGPVRARVRSMIVTENLNSLGGNRGLYDGIIGFSVLSLTEFLGLSEFAELKEREWWPLITEIADDLDVIGATGRNFRLLLDYVEEEYGGERHAN
ncbi:hypothetical protein ACFQDG_01925 [Natronoarchaeum mannanilyticum]|uniref:Uncharacterized protein n=1 Tax=Natronoarchaeum mannanilyticum TaxID=926360 RepID=A0AAV3TDL6_9EURY